MARSAEKTVAGALFGTTGGVVNCAKPSKAERTITSSRSKRGPTLLNSDEPETFGGFVAGVDGLPESRVDVDVLDVMSVPPFGTGVRIPLEQANSA
jgi:hypothetical protein